MRQIFLFGLIYLILSLTSTLAQDKDIQLQLSDLMLKHKAVGLTVAVVKNNELVYNKAMGYADLESKEKLTTQHLFRIASISKSFSATVIMQLIEEGQLSLDDDFGTLIGFPIRNPNYPDRIITLRMVLSHTSSINDKNGYFDLDVINPYKNSNWADSYNDYAPGEGYQYCNLNFNMVGAVIEKVAKNRFDLEMNNRIFAPMGLEAGYNVSLLDSNRFAQLYSYTKNGDFVAQPEAYNSRRDEIGNYKLGISTPIFSPTGGLKISTEDLTRYMRMHMNYGVFSGGKLISEASAKQMQTPISKTGYGLALLEDKTIIPGLELVGHTGSAYGLYSSMFFDPIQKFGFVVVTNGCEVSYDKDDNVILSKDVINCLYDYFIR